MAVRGYLAGIFRSIGETLSGESEEQHQLLTNPGFETGDATGWTGTATVSAGGRYGQGHYATLAATNSLTQTVTLSSALTANTDIVVRCWAEPAEAGCELEVDFLDNDTGASIAGAAETLTFSTTPTYEVNGWSLYSMRVTAPGHASTATSQTKSIKFTVTAGAAEALDVDDCEMVFVQQIAGATGELSGAITVETADITTFKSAQDNSGWRSHLPTLHSGEQIEVRAFTLDEDVLNIVENERVFVQLYSNVSANERWEFWAYATGLTGTFPLEGARETNIALTVDGHVGFCDTTED